MHLKRHLSVIQIGLKYRLRRTEFSSPLRPAPLQAAIGISSILERGLSLNIGNKERGHQQVYPPMLLAPLPEGRKLYNYYVWQNL